MRGGIGAAEYEYIVMGDADDSYDFLDLSGFIEMLDQGYDLVMGNRFKGGIMPNAMPFSHRYIGNPILSGIGRLFFKNNIGDFHCGLRAFRKASVEQLKLSTTGMEFASEMVVKAVLFRLKIAEIPCKLYPDGRDRKPHLRSIPDGLRHLEFLLIYSPRWLFVYPGMLFFFAGMLWAILIYIHPIQIGKVQFEVTTMFYSSVLMLLGFQMIQFSVFTGLFGERIGQFPPNRKLVHKVVRILDKAGYKAAAAVIIVGLAGVAFTLYRWGMVGFGKLSTTWICKTAILFGFLLAIGFELLLFTIFSRILRMGGEKG